MTKFLVVLCLGLTAGFTAKACDICACNISVQGVGLHQLIHANGIGLSYSGTRYSSNHEDGVQDRFHTLSLVGSYYFSNSWKMNMNIPIQWNSRRTREQNHTLSGMGDAQIMMHYLLKKDWGSCNESKLLLDLGAGLKLPTGAYDANLDTKNFPQNFNIGNGHTALVLQPGVAFSRKSFGVFVSGMYQYNIRKSRHYAFGDQARISGTIFYEFDMNEKMKIIPTVGAQWEFSNKDVFESGFKNAETGGYGILVPLGLSLRWSDFMIQSHYSMPIQQKYSNGGSQLEGRFVCQLNYFF